MTNPDGLTTISFDGDGTLWDFEKVMRHSLKYALKELCRAVPGPAGGLSIDAMIAIRDRVAEELKGKVTNLEKVRLFAFKRVLEHVGVQDDDLAAHLNAVYLRHRFEGMCPGGSCPARFWHGRARPAVAHRAAGWRAGLGSSCSRRTTASRNPTPRCSR